MVTFCASENADRLEVYTAKVESYLKDLEPPTELVKNELLITHINYAATAKSLEDVMRFMVSCACNMEIVSDMK